MVEEGCDSQFKGASLSSLVVKLKLGHQATFLFSTWTDDLRFSELKGVQWSPAVSTREENLVAFFSSESGSVIFTVGEWILDNDGQIINSTVANTEGFYQVVLLIACTFMRVSWAQKVIMVL